MKIKGKLMAMMLSALMATNVSAFASGLNIANDGFVDLTGGGAAPNSKVIIDVTKSDVDLENYDVWDDFSDSGSKTAFYGSSVSDENGNYEFNIYLPKSGDYIVRTSNEKFGEVRKERLKFINTVEQKEYIEQINKAVSESNKSEVINIIKNNKSGLGLFVSIYSDADLDKSGEILYDCLKQDGITLTAENVLQLIEKAMIISIIDSNEFTSIDKYSDGFGIDGTLAEEIYDGTLSSEITKIFKKLNPKAIRDYTDALNEAVFLAVINKSDSTDNVKKALKLFSDKISVSESEITTSLCQALMKERHFDSFGEVEECIKEYRKNKKSPDGGGGSNSGSRGYGAVTKSKDDIGEATFSQDIIDANKNDLSREIFNDMTDYQWAYESVKQLYTLGVVNGTDVGKFSPRNNVLREEFTKMITKAFKLSVTVR